MKISKALIYLLFSLLLLTSPTLFAANEQDLVDAAFKGNMDKVKTYLQSGVFVNGKDKQGNTALCVAVRNNNIDMVRLLLDSSADANLADSAKEAPFMIAFSKSNFEIMKALLDKNADVNIVDASGKSPLRIACEKNYTEIIAMLLKYIYYGSKRTNAGGFTL